MASCLALGFIMLTPIQNRLLTFSDVSEIIRIIVTLQLVTSHDLHRVN